MKEERKYAIKEEKFKELIEPFLEGAKQKLGRPRKVNHYNFLCAVLYGTVNKIAVKMEHGWHFIKPSKWLEVTLDADGSKYRFDRTSWSFSLGAQHPAVSIPRTRTKATAATSTFVYTTAGE